MVAVTWSDDALSDVANIAEYVSQDSVRYANRLVSQFFERAEILSKFPRVGRIVPELGIDEVRELMEGNYRIIYEVLDENSVAILNVVHSARRFPPEPA